jgi:hypothetical protein
MTPRRDHSRTVLRRLVVAPGGSPASRERNHGRFVLLPVVQGGGIEIGAVRPHEGVDFTVERDGIELIEVAQRPVEFPSSNGRKSMKRMRPSSNSIRSRYGPSISNAFTRWIGCPIHSPIEAARSFRTAYLPGVDPRL